MFYCSQFSGVHVHFSILDHESSVLHLGLVKSAFHQFQVEVFLLHPFKNSLGSFLAFFLSFSKY